MRQQDLSKALSTGDAIELCGTIEGNGKLPPLVTLSYLAVALAMGGGCEAIHCLF